MSELKNKHMQFDLMDDTRAIWETLSFLWALETLL